MLFKLVLLIATVYNLYLFHIQIPDLVSSVSLLALLATTWGIFLYNSIYGFLNSWIAKITAFFLPYLFYNYDPKMFIGLYCFFMFVVTASFAFCGLMGKNTIIMFAWLFTLPIVLQYGIFLFYYYTWVERQMYLQIEVTLLLMVVFYILYLYSFSKYMIRATHIIIEKGER